MIRYNPFHLVDQSPWPILSSACVLQLALGLLLFIHSKNLSLLTISLIILIRITYIWWRDVSRESSYLRFHISIVQTRLRIGIILFIISEVCFFFGFFWTFFHSRLNVIPELGCWPPYGILTLDPINLPFLNTVVLLSSRITITFSHHNLIIRKYINSLLRLIFTLFLRFFFTFLQGIEYNFSPFNMSDSVYRSIFFLATRFHRFHVLIRSFFLIVNFFRLKNRQLTIYQHIRYECAIWYWHFVDVVWVLLYTSFYWWRSL